MQRTSRIKRKLLYYRILTRDIHFPIGQPVMQTKTLKYCIKIHSIQSCSCTAATNKLIIIYIVFITSYYKEGRPMYFGHKTKQNKNDTEI